MGWFKGFVAALVAFVFTACFIGVLHYTSFERHHTHDWPHQHANHGSITGYEDNPSTYPPVTITDGSEAPLRAKPTQTNPAHTDDKSLEHYNHKAQVFMAVFAGLGLMIGALGLFFIWRTLGETKKAAIAASRTLDEATKATQAARDTLDSERAWLVMCPGMNNFLRMGGNDIDGQKFYRGIATNVGFLNAGRSPAINVETFHRDWKGVGDIPTQLSEMNKRNEINANMLIGQQQPLHTTDILIKDEDLDKWINREIRWIVYAQATYKTIFSDDIQFTQIMVEMISSCDNFTDLSNIPHSIHVSPVFQKIGKLDKNDKN